MSLKSAIKSKNSLEIKKVYNKLPIPEIIQKLEKFSIKEVLICLRHLKVKNRPEIFAKLNSSIQEKLVRLFTEKEMKEIVGELYTSEIANLIEDLPKNLTKRILEQIDKETKSDVKKILQYSDDQTGSIMKVDILLIKQTNTINQTIKLLIKNKEEINFTHNLFVINSKKKLQGYIVIEDLLINDRNNKISSIIKPTSWVTTTTDKEEAADEFAQSDMSALPVINSSKEVIGMITADDVIDVVIEEATEDMQKMAGIGVNEYKSYTESKTWHLFKSRTLWLMLLMISATLSQIVLDAFQNYSNKILPITLTTAIIAILPVISGAAGNAGSQTSTTVIRALSTGDINNKDYLKIFWKELKVSILIGFVLGLINFGRLMIYYSIKNSLDLQYIFLSLAASISLLSVIVLAKLTGGLLPLVAKNLKLDPAVMAAPLLTTLIDALSTTIFFAISIGVMILII